MQINFFTFSPMQQIVELTLYTEKHPELTGVKSLFYSLTNPAECKGTQYTVQINLNNQKQRRIAKHIISQQLYNHFRQSQIATFDKIDNVEVWVKKKLQSTTGCTEYLRFSLIPQYAVFSDSWELVISFNGISMVYNKPLSVLDLQTDHFKVVVGGEVVKYKNLPITIKYPEMVAEIVPHFSEAKLPQFGKNNLWFL